MKVTIKKGFSAQPILDRLSKLRTLQKDGTISVVGLGILDEYESYFRTAVEIEGKTDAFVWSVVKSAMHSKQSMTETEFVDACKKLAEQKIKNNQRLFKIVFPIWGSILGLYGRRVWGDVTIHFDVSKGSKFFKRVMRDRSKLLDEHNKRTNRNAKTYHELPIAICTTKAIGPQEALEKAELAVSKELGLYSLVLSRGKFMFSIEPEKPINDILIAPCMTVHNPNGSLSAETFWYNRWPLMMTTKSRPASEAAKIQKEVQRIRGRVKSLPWRSEAEEALSRHYLAFSQCDLESSFLDGWRLLEAIGGHRLERSESLVRRAAWFFEDREAEYQRGLHLMERRNLFSHGRPIRDENKESLAFQMRRFIGPLLRNYLMNPFKFESREELWSFCDLPVDKKSRERRQYLLRCGSSFRRDK